MKPEPGRNVWKIAKAERACVIVDAEDYFRMARAAMLKAQRRIMLIGWDFDARIDLMTGRKADDGAPTTIGDLITWMVEQNPKLEIYLLRWDLGAMKSFFRARTFVTIAKWMRHPRIHVKLDGHHPPAASHHQKIVVIDDCFAFCGGIDMTGERWDSRSHDDGEPGRVLPDGTPYKPWHDATTALQGPIAAMLGKHARERWRRAGGKPPRAVPGQHDCWPEDLPVQFTDVDVAIARTAPRMKGQREVIEIEQLYLDQIARAERFIYAESQYFASRRIAEAIGKRLKEKNGPEIVVINPVSAQGWLEPLAMDTARARLIEALRKLDKHKRFRVYHPHTRGGEPIYVHAKVMIVDDMILRVGSSNMNNRSLRLDTECDVTIDTTLPGNEDERETIAAIRNDLIAEHLGTKPARVAELLAEKGSLIDTIETLRARRGGPRRTLDPYETPNLSEVEEWLADNEILDPEGPEEMFEPLHKRGLLRRLRHWRHRH